MGPERTTNGTTNGTAQDRNGQLELQDTLFLLFLPGSTLAVRGNKFPKRLLGHFNSTYIFHCE
jgi:hypothetical protein